MAKDIDLTSKLSDDDKAWLLERGRYADVAAAEGSSVEEVISAESEATADDYEIPFKPLVPSDAAEAKYAGTATGGSAYDDLTVAELKDELGQRDLAVGGNKAELIARLQEDDASSAEGSTEQ